MTAGAPAFVVGCNKRRSSGESWRPVSRARHDGAQPRSTPAVCPAAAISAFATLSRGDSACFSLRYFARSTLGPPLIPRIATKTGVRAVLAGLDRDRRP